MQWFMSNKPQQTTEYISNLFLEVHLFLSDLKYSNNLLNFWFSWTIIIKIKAKQRLEKFHFTYTKKTNQLFALKNRKQSFQNATGKKIKGNWKKKLKVYLLNYSLFKEMLERNWSNSIKYQVLHCTFVIKLQGKLTSNYLDVNSYWV